MDWSQVLDIELALKNVRKDVYGDWYRDPWDWPEYATLIDQHVETVFRRANSAGLSMVAQIDVPKENFGTRPAVILDPLDRVLYQALVDRQSKSAIGDMKPWVFGWRLPRTQPTSGNYSPNRTEWSLYQGKLSGLVATNDCGLKTDIVSCFASINVYRVADDLISRCGGSRVSERLIDVITSFDRIPGRSGLPQRSKASATLANMYLSRLDVVLSEQVRKHDRRPDDRRGLFTFLLNNGGTTRWMDDVWIFGKDEAVLRSAQLVLQRASREAGLEMNIGKTAAFEGDDLAEAALRLQHSAVDGALGMDEPSVAPLEELLDEIIADPQGADRSSIHFAFERMRRFRIESRKDELIAMAEKMPHGADHLARAFRDFGWWRDLQEWFLDYERSPWGAIRWSVANLGAMFPSGERVSKKLCDRYVDMLTERPPAPLFALTAQRLASWDPPRARAIFREVLPNANHPIERRILGLAALAASDEKNFVRSVLNDYEENDMILRVIEDRNFRPFRPAPDFAGSASD